MVGALLTIPIILSCGVVSYQAIGPQYVAAGILGAFVSAILSSVIAGLFGGPPLHVNSPKTSHAAILSSLIAVVAIHHSFTDYYKGEAASNALMVICFLTLLVSGVAQTLFGLFRLGTVVKFVPYPVLAGIVNGFALQIILGQVPSVFGVRNFNQVWAALTGHSALVLWPLGFAVGTCVLVLVAGRIGKTIPPVLVGLIGGTAAYAAASSVIDPGVLGPVIGKLPTGLSFVLRAGDIFDFLPSYAFHRHIFPIVATGLTLALVSSIQSLLSISNADELFDTRHDSNKELVVQGLSNMASAIFGGAPNGGSPNTTKAVYANGGRSRYANLVIGVSLFGFSFGLADAIAMIPLSVMAGVVILTTGSAMDSWTRQLMQRIGRSSQTSARGDVLINLLVVILVTLLVLTEGALAALGVGMAATFLIFLYRVNSGVVGRVRYADRLMSRTDRPLALAEEILRNPRCIAVVDLHGPLFFGNADTVGQKVEAELRTSSWVILSFRRCSMIDTSGAMVLKRLDAGAKKSGKRMFLAYLPEGGRRREYLRNVGVSTMESEGRIFDDVDAALACAENELLRKAHGDSDRDSERPLAEFDVVGGLTPEQIVQLESHMEHHRYAVGDCIIAEGAEDHGLYFLTRGQVSIYTRNDEMRLRLASYVAGTDVLFGEMAILTGARRSADVYADTEVAVLKLTNEAFEALCNEAPQIATRLMRRVSATLAKRLAKMTQLVRELET